MAYSCVERLAFLLCLLQIDKNTNQPEDWFILNFEGRMPFLIPLASSC
jgi:hypothetical protein